MKNETRSWRYADLAIADERGIKCKCGNGHKKHEKETRKEEIRSHLESDF